MPNLTLSHSRGLSTFIDWRNVAMDLHGCVAATAGTEVANCRTRIMTIQDTITGDGTVPQAVCHVEIAVLKGRSESTQNLVANAVLAQLMLAKHSLPVGLAVRWSVEVRDISRAYAKG